MKAEHIDKTIEDHTWTEFDWTIPRLTPAEQKPESKLLIPDKTNIRYDRPNREHVICGRCGKQGLKYPTYIQHSLDRPPTSPHIVDGKLEGWNWQRCDYPIVAVKTKRKAKFKNKTRKERQPKQIPNRKIAETRIIPVVTTTEANTENERLRRQNEEYRNIIDALGMTVSRLVKVRTE